MLAALAPSTMFHMVPHQTVGHAPGMTLNCRGQFNRLIVPGRICFPAPTR